MKLWPSLALGCGGTLLVAVLTLMWLGSSELTRPQPRELAPASALANPKPFRGNKAPSAAETATISPQPPGPQAQDPPSALARINRNISETDRCMDELMQVCKRDPLAPEIKTYTQRCAKLVQRVGEDDYSELKEKESFIELGQAAFYTFFGYYRWEQQVEVCRKAQEQAHSNR